MEERYGASATTLQGHALDMVRLRARFWGLLTLIPNITMAFVVLIGGIAVAHGDLSLGAIVAFTTLVVLLQNPIIDLGWILSMAQEAATAADRVCEIFDADITVRDRPSAVALVRPRGRLAFEHVGFSYPTSTSPVLRDVNVTIEPGETPRSRRVDRIGQEHAGVAPGSALRRHVRSHHARWSGHPGHHTRLAPPPGGDGLRRPRAVLDERAREPHPRPPRRQRRRHTCRARPRPGPVHVRPALGARHPYRRARTGAVGRAAATARPRPCGHRAAGRARARRPALRPRREHRGPRRGEPGTGARAT